MRHADWRFCDEDGAVISPRDWLTMWSSRFSDGKYDKNVHDDLIARHTDLTPLDFERIGRWKDAANTELKWRPNVASVAYPIWMQASAELPKCPDDSDVVSFLGGWASRSYEDHFQNGIRRKSFGLSRATTLLYFLSGGRYPIFDSRVRTAVKRLCGISVPRTAEAYLAQYCALFDELMTLCGSERMRSVDRALFAYGEKIPSRGIS